ncbi:uncharacterized protein LOC130929024 isoform X2 [Corythoichthys intestinalis]|uniref:uncharacterized protein LOC130929024 isoform X2 n=1 Tax=Corythoichthys intestinalis TaxID=161448 RepID=UPI0025A63041|nr:uncharacterized protein LOC130929024 isoform X2 [Corythoichthys intestinalis]
MHASHLPRVKIFGLTPAHSKSFQSGSRPGVRHCTQSVCLTLVEPFGVSHKPRRKLHRMSLVIRLVFVLLALACTYVLSLVTSNSEASSQRVVGADVMKMSSYSPSGHNQRPSSGLQSSQQYSNIVFHSQSPEYKLIQPDKNIRQYPVVILKSAPGHPLQRNREEEPQFEAVSAVDAPKTPASRSNQSGPRTLWRQAGQYLNERHDGVQRMSSTSPPGRFQSRQPNTSVLRHSPSPRANDKTGQSVFFKPSFVRREDFGKPLNSAAVSKKDKRLEKYTEKETVVNAGRYQAASRFYLPANLASRLVATTTRKPVPQKPSESVRKSLWDKNSFWPASSGMSYNSLLNKRQGYTFKIANNNRAPLSKYSFSQRTVEPRTSAAPFLSGSPHLEDHDAAVGRSNKSDIQQILPDQERNSSHLAFTSPVPRTRHRTGSDHKEIPVSERVELKLPEWTSRLFGTSTSSTVRGRRVNGVHRTGLKHVLTNSPIVRLPRRHTSTTLTPTATTLTYVTESEIPELLTTIEERQNIKPNDESSGSEVSDFWLNENLEDSSELNYLRISTGNVTFKSL